MTTLSVGAEAGGVGYSGGGALVGLLSAAARLTLARARL